MRLVDALFGVGPFKNRHPQQELAPLKIRIKHWIYAEVAFPMIMYARKPGNLRWRFGWWINERFCL